MKQQRQGSNVSSIKKIKIMSIVGARPNFMKVAPIIAAIRAHNQAGLNPYLEHTLVHTGQHYDNIMSDSFFNDLRLPKPDVHLGVGSGSHAKQTADIMAKFEDVLNAEKPNVVLVVGDVNSTVACALVTAKIAFDSNGTRPLIGHVEAGLRSGDRTMPEEVNRVMTDHLSDLHFVTEESGIENLRHEGINPEKIHFVGNTMIDSLLAFREQAEESQILEKLSLRQAKANNGNGNGVSRYALLTLHRPANVDNLEAFLNILNGLEDLAENVPIIFPVHPRTKQRIKEFGTALPIRISQGGTSAQEQVKGQAGLVVTDPLGYLDFLCLMKNAEIVVTDSGGIQEETTCLKIPCVTVRDNTERPVTVRSGTNTIAGTKKEGIKAAIQKQLAVKGGDTPRNWDGKAAGRIVEVIARVCAAQE